MALSPLRQTSGDWAVEPRSLRAGVLATRTLMRDEGRRSVVHVLNVSKKDYVVGRGKFFGEAEQVTVAGNTGTAWKPSSREDVLSEAVAVFPEGSDEAPALEESRDVKHIQVVIENLPPELDLDQHTATDKFIRDRAGLFSKSDFDIGRTNLVRQVSDTGMHRPFKQPLRRHPHAHIEIIDGQVTEMLRKDAIEPAASPWASNVVLVRKANGQLRFCADYRQLNLYTYKRFIPFTKD